MVPKPFPAPNIPTLPDSGCGLVLPVDVGPGDCGAPAVVFLLVSLAVLVEEGLGDAGGAPVTQSNVVVSAVEETMLFWVEWGLGVGWGGGFTSVGAEGE